MDVFKSMSLKYYKTHLKNNHQTKEMEWNILLKRKWSSYVYGHSHLHLISKFSKKKKKETGFYSTKIFVDH